MDEALLRKVFTSIEFFLPLPGNALQLDKNKFAQKLLGMFDEINKAKRNVFGEVVDNILNNIYWKNINIIDIEPEDISLTLLLLKDWAGQVEPLVCVSITAEMTTFNSYRNYLSEHIQKPLIVKTYCKENKPFDISLIIDKIRERHNPNNLFLFSSFSQQKEALLRELQKCASHKDYFLFLAATYEGNLLSKMIKKITNILKNDYLPAAWQYFSITSDDGIWSYGYHE